MPVYLYRSLQGSWKELGCTEGIVGHAHPETIEQTSVYLGIEWVRKGHNEWMLGY